METTTFTALCERAGRWWTIRVPQVEGLTAQVRSLDQAEVVTRQLIARTLAIPAESIRVDSAGYRRRIRLVQAAGLLRRDPPFYRCMRMI